MVMYVAPNFLAFLAGSDGCAESELDAFPPSGVETGFVEVPQAATENANATTSKSAIIFLLDISNDLLIFQN
jgi:hypothetical protein